MSIVPFEATHTDGFRSLVADTLPEFGFGLDPAFDSDLDDPAGAYAALWVAVEDEKVVGSVALRDLGDGVLELKRMYLRPSRRGLGLGKRLLGVALDYARARRRRGPPRHQRADGCGAALVRGARLRARVRQRPASGAVPAVVRATARLAQRDDALSLGARPHE